MSTGTENGWVRAADAGELAEDDVRVVLLEGQTIALFKQEGAIYAVDNRCPHLGFPLSQGSVRCGILTCHWHHARFDLTSGGTFDPWADDVRSYPVRIEDGGIWVDLAPPAQPAAERFRARLGEGLKRNIRLLIAKSVIGLQAANAPETIALEVGADFGTRCARNGWGSGLTILAAMANILPHLRPDDRARALYHGLMHVATQTAGQPPAFLLEPLQTRESRPVIFKQWFREFLEVRDRDGAERVLRSAIATGSPMPVVADMLFTAATDHRYLSGGHALDFINKAFELLDQIGWQHAEYVLPSLVPELARGQRSEEQANWRRPVDLAGMLEAAFGEIPDRIERGQRERQGWDGEARLVETLLGEEPACTISALLDALSAGGTSEELAAAVAFAAARRIAQFRTSNEFGDWITVLHTFTYANAVHQAIRRTPSSELLRGVFDAAISVYLDRFLNTPPAPLPRVSGDRAESPGAILATLDRQQAVEPFARQVSVFLQSGQPDTELLALLGQALVQEDAEFHTFQVVEAGFRQYVDRRGTEEGRVILLAVARYLAAHAPTSRASGQTYQTALRLQRGEEIYADGEEE